MNNVYYVLHLRHSILNPPKFCIMFKRHQPLLRTPKVNKLSFMTKQSYILVSQNKKAFHNYTFTEKLEVGIVLLGNEVKSIRQGRIHLRDSFARIINEELWLFNCHITPYTQAHRISKIDPVRNRKLLLHKHQLKKWIGKVQEKGLTLVPTKLYFSGSKVKLEIGLGKAKKLHDKRAQLKEKAANRDIQRHLKR